MLRTFNQCEALLGEAPGVRALCAALGAIHAHRLVTYFKNTFTKISHRSGEDGFISRAKGGAKRTHSRGFAKQRFALIR